SSRHASKRVTRSCLTGSVPRLVSIRLNGIEAAEPDERRAHEVGPALITGERPQPRRAVLGAAVDQPLQYRALLGPQARQYPCNVTHSSPRRLSCSVSSYRRILVTS